MSMAKTPETPTGAFAAPPPGAPRETSQPLSPALVKQQRDKARAHERTLASLKPSLARPPILDPAAPPEPEPADPSPLAALVGVPPERDAEGKIIPLAERLAKMSDGAKEAPKGVPVLDPGPVPGPQPAASSEEDPVEASPSRGKPQPIADPGKKITGGWGLAGGEAAYFALAGDELATVVRELMVKVSEAMDRDLRFSLAVTYPQVRVRVTVTVDGAESGAQVNDIRFDLQEARLFTLEEQAQDDQETPADYHRDQVGLTRPQKHAVQSGAGRLVVDIEV